MEVDAKHIVELQGKKFVKYDGLLEMAHKVEGFQGITTELISNENGVAIFKAIAKTDKQEFHSHGDAHSKNVNSMILPHMIRMAETRAKARALRDLTNVGMCSIEEMTDVIDQPTEQPNPALKDKLPDGGGYKGSEGMFVSKAQQGRLFALAGYDKDDKDGEASKRAKGIVDTLLKEYELKATGEIKKGKEYNEICEKAELLLADALIPVRRNNKTAGKPAKTQGRVLNE